MLIKTLILLYAILASIPVIGQYRTDVGGSYTLIDAEIKRYFYQNGEILAVKVTSHGSVYLQKFKTSTLENISARVYHGLPSSFKVERILEFNNRYYLFYSTHENGGNNLNYWEIDFSTGDLIGQGRPLISINENLENIQEITASPAATRHEFNIVLSSDDMAMAVEYQLHPKNRKGKKSLVGIHLFNKELNELWNKTVSIPYPKKRVKNIDCFPDSKGNILLMTRVLSKNSSKQTQLLIFKANGSDTLQQIDIPLAGKSPHFSQLHESNAGEIVGIGFYTRELKRNNKNPSTDGVFTFTIPMKGPESINTYEIPAHILTQYRNRTEIHKIARKEARDVAEFENLVLQHIELLESGEILVIGEQRYLLSSTRPPKELNNQPGRSTNFNFHNRDILLIKLTESDTLQWMRKIPRHQVHDALHNKVGFVFTENNEGHNLFYLDDKNNLKLNSTDTPTKLEVGEGRFLIHSQVNKETGEVTKTLALDFRNINGVEITEITPHQVIITEPDVIVFEAITKRKDLLLNKKENVLIKVFLK